ncbi:hypothetical protein [Nesterenkonia flava]|uniref:Uncharacterized protein n=1 Tax=Nesterenkonia flava TaxID=469799 RepID=A0ABU1FWQ3_9MICC|nr:hypothetical protein [Nesterenkonia flava]MDR5713112.1 hypothetical protein [Nesterenkonia flava]
MNGESRYEGMGLQENDADGRVLTATFTNDPHTPSLWERAVAHNDPLFAYQPEDQE